MVVNIPVPKRATIMNGTKLKDGNDQIPSKNSTPKKTRNNTMIPKNMRAPVFFFI
jgi:hypothetical protein